MSPELGLGAALGVSLIGAPVRAWDSPAGKVSDEFDAVAESLGAGGGWPIVLRVANVYWSYFGDVDGKGSGLNPGSRSGLCWLSEGKEAA